MDGFQQWRCKASERKAFRVLTGAAYELRYVHLGHQVFAAFREAIRFGKQVSLPCLPYRRQSLLVFEASNCHEAQQMNIPQITQRQ